MNSFHVWSKKCERQVERGRMTRKCSAECTGEIYSRTSFPWVAQVKHCFAFESQLRCVLWRIPFAVQGVQSKGNAAWISSGSDMARCHTIPESLTGFEVLTSCASGVWKCCSSLENERQKAEGMGAAYPRESLARQKPGRRSSKSQASTWTSRCTLFSPRMWEKKKQNQSHTTVV